MEKKTQSRKKIFIVVAIILLVGVGTTVFVLFQNYNAPLENAGAVEPDKVYSADEFVEAFNDFETEDEAAKYFDDQVIQIKGSIESISDNQGTIDVLVGSSDPITSINVNLVSEMKEVIKKYKSGDGIVVQAYFTGKLLDIELNRGVIVE